MIDTLENRGESISPPMVESSHSENINELATALSKAQAEMNFAIKDSENKFLKNKYADLSSVWEACRDPLTKNSLSIVQLVDGINDKGFIVLKTMLMHSSGQWIKSYIAMKPADDKPQTYGSTLTYARRYALSAMVGVIQDDDDGNEGSGLKKKGNSVSSKKEVDSEKEEAKPKNNGQPTSEFHCTQCNAGITKAENEFSKKTLGKALCRKHQAEVRAKK